MTTPPSPHPFAELTPQAVLDLLEACGFRGDGRLLQLNSYENRVFQVMLEDGRAVVAKFYRPGRWSDAQIAEEHAFAAELAADDVPVPAPLPTANGQTLGRVPWPGPSRTAAEALHWRVAVYPRHAGHGPELDRVETLERLGHYIGRLHVVGARRPFQHRLSLHAPDMAQAAVARIRALGVLPPAQARAWLAAAEQAQRAISAAWAAAHSPSPIGLLRLHGDCHAGNMLWLADRAPTAGEPAASAGPCLVDLDDALNGPAVQDVWMALAGDRAERQRQLAALLRGYRRFRRFDARELALIEPLRSLRMLRHSAWMAERWDDPAFPAAFPWFGSAAYWDQQATELREQCEAMADAPLDDPALFWPEDEPSVRPPSLS